MGTRRPGRPVPRRKVILTGFMGSGKSAVGRALARLARRRFVDLDRMVEGRARMGVARIFRRHGEKAFRAMETRAIAGLQRSGPAVVAAGGGAPLLARNRRLLKRAGLVVYLKVPVGKLASRIGSGRGRPLMAPAGGDPAKIRALVARLLGVREPRYLSADIVFRGGWGTPRAEAMALLRAIRASHPDAL